MHVCWRNSAFTGAGVSALAWSEAALVLMSATQAAQPLEHAGGAADFQHFLRCCKSEWRLAAVTDGTPVAW